MQVTVNGEMKMLVQSGSLESLLLELNIESRYFAVALNRAFVPKHLYEATMIQDGDEIEILSPMQGG